MINLNKEINFIKKNINKQLISIILFGSYARETNSKYSDIDLLIIVEDNFDSQDFEKKILGINKNISAIITTKSEFKKKIINFNSQLISLFIDGKILFDKNNYYYKNRNLFIALNYNKEYNISYKGINYSINKLVRQYGF